MKREVMAVEEREILRRFDEMLSEGRIKEAGEYLEEMADNCRASGDGAAAISVLNELEGYWRVAGRRDKSYAAAETALSLLDAEGLSGTIAHATTLLNYATAKSAFGETEEAMRLYEDVERIYKSQLPNGDYRVASLNNNMAQSLLRERKPAEALCRFESSLSILKALDDVDGEMATCLTNIAVCLMALKRLDEAEKSLDAAEVLFSASSGDDPHRDSMVATRGQLEFMRGRYLEAARLYGDAAEGIKRRFGANVNYARACRNCARACEAAGRTDEARRYREFADECGTGM